MNLIINLSNLYVGGGIQVGLSFINELNKSKSNDNFYLFVSKPIINQIDKNKFGEKFHFYLIPKPSLFLIGRFSNNKLLKKLENFIKPDITFTLFGPSYWKPKSTHITGFADGWVYNPNSIAYDKLPPIKRIQRIIVCKAKGFFLRKDASFFIVETSDAKKKLADTLNIVKNKIFVVGNTYSDIFRKKEYTDVNNKYYIKLPPKQKNEYRLVYISHNYENKNLKIITKILPLLKNENIKFILTIDQKEFDKTFYLFKKNIINLGPISHFSCPSVYKQCDALFAPTLLETFSAAYPESMKMGLPILTSNLSFAQNICKDAALYFNPLQPYDIVKKIKLLINDKTLHQNLLKKGKNRLKNFETAKSRALKYLYLCKKVSKKVKFYD